MTGFSIRRATPDEAAIISAHRRAMFAEIAEPAAARLDALEAAFLPWVTQRLASEAYLGWLAPDVDGAVVAGAGPWLMDWPPHIIGQKGCRGNILNVYVLPKHRGPPLARQLVHIIHSWCRAHGIDVVILQASDAARPLYAELGFVASNEMRWLLDKR